jgi:hypothetical protein
MKTTDPVDAARIELLLTELRLPAVEAMWAKFAAQTVAFRIVIIWCFGRLAFVAPANEQRRDAQRRAPRCVPGMALMLEVEVLCEPW